MIEIKRGGATTPVIFKLDKQTKTPVAFFPTLPGTDHHDVACYAHVGQHSAASINYLSECKPAKPEQYAGLLAELRQIGYDGLEIVRRRTPAHNLTRFENSQALKG